MLRDPPEYEVSVQVTASTSVQEFSKVFEGLNALRAAGKVRLCMEPVRDLGAARILTLTARKQAGTERRIAIDIDDDPQIPESTLLRSVDVYFKRSMRPETVEQLERDTARKVHPFGLNNPAIRPATALRVLRARSRTGRDLRDLARDARQLFALPTPQAFELAPDSPTEPIVMLQTRLWSPATSDPDRHEINEERAMLIRSLRAAFGSRFIGGAIPTPFVRERYPDLVTTLPFGMRAYPRLLKRALVTVYSRGLRDSVAFKMSEYLAASRCIVGHRPTALLPAPLAEGQNYLRFETVDECIARCEGLLSRPDEAAAMRHANWRYYQQHVEPSAHLRAVLDCAFQAR